MTGFSFFRLTYGGNHEKNTQQQGNYSMNVEIEKSDEFVLENNDVLLIRDLRVLGIYTFVKMMISQGEYTVPVIIDKMKEQFLINDKEVLDALKVIIEDLCLITMSRTK